MALFMLLTAKGVKVSRDRNRIGPQEKKAKEAVWPMFAKPQ